jgi:hypothetical protein
LSIDGWSMTGLFAAHLPASSLVPANLVVIWGDVAAHSRE